MCADAVVTVCFNSIIMIELSYLDNIQSNFFFFVESGNKDEFEKRSKETKTWYIASIISGIIIIAIYLILTLV